MTSINIPNSVVLIERDSGESFVSKGTFESCINLSSITFSNKLTFIPERCFLNCFSLSNFEIPNGVKYIEKKAFSYTGTSSQGDYTVTINNSVNKIHTTAFLDSARGKQGTFLIKYTEKDGKPYWYDNETNIYTIDHSNYIPDNINVSYEIVNDDTSPLKLHTNGVTVIANHTAKLNESYDFNGVTYKVVDQESLKEWALNMKEWWYNGKPDDGSYPGKVVTTYITSMYDLFEPGSRYEPLNEDISNWDVSRVTSFYNLFRRMYDFQQSLNNWDTSSALRMSSMFRASNFNQPIDNWNVSNVDDMSLMFLYSLFNRSLNNWERNEDPNNTSTLRNVTNMYGIFGYNNNFNSEIGKWNVSNVTDPRFMFYETSFNKSLNDWDTTNWLSAVSIFNRARQFNQPINWTLENVEDFQYMFYLATSFNQPLNNFNTSNAIIMEGMFSNATSFNQPLNNFDTSNVTTMEKMFEGATSFNQPLNNFDTSNVITMKQMFEGATSFNQPLNNFDTSNVITMNQMFEGATSFNQNLNFEIKWYETNC